MTKSEISAFPESEGTGQMISIQDLKAHIADLDPAPPRTRALEERIGIGAGFHDKWYRSQKEHMLGWLVVQEAQARMKDEEPSRVDARGMWSRLKCSPMMFWLAEAGGVSESHLDEAEKAAEAAAMINPKDGEPHGKLMRAVLPWEVVAEAIRARGDRVKPAEAEEAASVAFDRLTSMVPAYRKHRRWIR
jgi:hypothetical protein